MAIWPLIRWIEGKSKPWCDIGRDKMAEAVNRVSRASVTFRVMAASSLGAAIGESGCKASRGRIWGSRRDQTAFRRIEIGYRLFFGNGKRSMMVRRACRVSF
jgi:hypothetical protein